MTEDQICEMILKVMSSKEFDDFEKIQMITLLKQELDRIKS